jgi:hypothetical protein
MRTCLVFLLLLFSGFIHAQSREREDHDEQPRVMIIPYDPQFYLSDADHDIVEATRKEPAVIRESFRRTADRYVLRTIRRFRPCLSLLNDADSLPQLKEVLWRVYSHTGYRYEKAILLPAIQARIDSLNKSLKKINRENTDSRTAYTYYQLPADALYMNAILSKPAVLQELHAEYGTEIFVFLNQFEIKTNYKNCLDIANKIYQRELLLHFSIYDYNGRQLAGSYALASFPSDSNHASDIMHNCLPEIARLIAGCIP